jgi:hypothetical protein
LGAYLKTFHVYNLNDRSSVGAKVEDVKNQIRTFFLTWKDSDITETVVPKGKRGGHTNVVPPFGSLQGTSRYMEDEYISPWRHIVEGGPRPRPVFLDSDVALVFITHNDVCHNVNGAKEMSDWTEELTDSWDDVISHAKLFPRAAIICGGPASTMGWSDFRYAKYTNACIGRCLAEGVFAFDGGEYFRRMEMGWDDWH